MKHLYVPGLMLLAASGSIAQLSLPQPDTLMPSSVGAAKIIGQHQKLQADYQALRRAVQQGDSLAVAETCYLLGKRYSSMGDFLTANQWFLRSLRIREPHGPSEGLGKLYLRMAEQEVTLGRFKSALQHAHRALTTHRQIQSRHGIMSAYSALGNVHLHGWQTLHRPMQPFSLDSAFYYFRQAEQIARTFGDSMEIAHIYNYAGVAETFRDRRRAIAYLNRALTIYDQNGHSGNRVKTRLALAHVYLTSRQFKTAHQLLDTARQLYATHRLTDYYLLDQLEMSYADLYGKMGDWKQAFMHQRKAHEIQYAALSADQNGAVARLNIVFDTEKREATIKSQQRELALRAATLDAQRKLTGVTLGLMALAVGASLVFFRLNQKNQRISRQNLELVNEQSHRIQNHLQAVSNLLSLQSIRLTDTLAKRAVEESQLRVQVVALLHRQLYSRKDQPTSVAVDQYIPELVQGVLAAFGLKTVQPEYDLTPLQLQTNKALPVGLILNEVVTNACKYAFPTLANPVLKVSFKYESGFVRLTVSDNGPGFAAPQAEESGTSYGLRLIQLQARQLQGSYEFLNQNGTQFSLTFPA